RYPSVDSEGNLYFASDGYQGFGGLDICVSINNNGTFQKAIPMKAPFNSSYDDYGVTFIEDGRIGYISSNRYENGKGDDDILYFNLSEDNVPATLVTSVYTMGYKQKPKAEVAPKVMFAVNSPENIPLERRVRETFPIRNYIFFDLESTKIPDRYVLLTKDEVKNFKETNLEVFTPKTLSGRSTRQMIAYYNILNILGNRMGENPNSTIVVVGSSEKGVEDGKLMAESVKKYLVDVFQIKSTRINIEGRVKPKLPSEQPNAANDLVMLREGDRRVSVESDAPAILMEFQSGPDVPLKPVEIDEVQVAPMDSYITIQADGGKNPFTSWSLEVSDEKGKTQVFGPYYQNQISIPGKSILGTRSNGDYKFVMIGKTANETILKKDTTVRLVLWIPDVKEEGIRYSVLYEYDDSKSIYIYEKYLSEVVVPKIPVNGKVIIHGYTDIVGDANYNLSLSTARANDVKKIMETALSKTNRKDVKFEVRGFGENASLSPFENKFPEERFYNRTVIIDIIPAKSK
ncbi:MAG: OmpA family protein, partial [Salinivirgaceae bacterium]|nr:OmpA family protein [Salinivirgaceae bacterium]